MVAHNKCPKKNTKGPEDSPQVRTSVQIPLPYTRHPNRHHQP